jgi:hypothetical protein
MDARAKLDRLKYTWVGYGIVVAILEIVRDGLYSDSIVAAAIRIALTWFFAVYLTRQLWQKSSLVWAFGVVFGLIGTIAAGIVMIEELTDPDGYGFDLVRFLLAGASGYVHFRTFRLLRDRDVKRHVMLDD